MTRQDGRSADQLRPLSFQPDIAPNATGSVLVATGDTRVICTATITDEVPRWMKEQKVTGGWVTAEYGMLPGSTLDRKARDITRGKPDSRSTEIQRLIGRSLRAAIDLDAMGPRTLWLDCDVLQADGGTRTASITGACVAAAFAFQRLVADRRLKQSPLARLVVAVSAGVFDGTPLLDLNYIEDRDAAVDCNLVFAEDLRLVEIQATGEEASFSKADLDEMIRLGESGARQLLEAQRALIASREPLPNLINNPFQTQL
jgi:ribonuclease PH